MHNWEILEKVTRDGDFPYPPLRNTWFKKAKCTVCGREETASGNIGENMPRSQMQTRLDCKGNDNWEFQAWWVE